MSALKITALRTEIFHAKENLNHFITSSLLHHQIKEGDILAVTSKVVSLAEGRTVSKNQVDKHQLIKSEADCDLGEVAYGCRLTIKHGLFIPSAGIDESNSEKDEFILFPQDPFLSAQNIYQHLKQTYALKNVGVLITDSHTLPLRKGVTGIALSYAGFSGVKNKIGQNDIFGRPLQMTKMDLADGLAAAAVLMMGEADEQQPLAIIENAPVDFHQDTVSLSEIAMPMREDLYFPLYSSRLS